MKLFFGQILDDSAILNEEESHHFTKVLRGKLGDTIHVTDGNGKIAEIEISVISKKVVEGNIIDLKNYSDSKKYYLHIAIAPTKNIDRLEFFLEKATEIGIDEITFLQTYHSERKSIKIDRIEKILQSAAKQSLKAYLPKINNLTKLNEFTQSDFSNYAKYIAHCNSNFDRVPLKQILKSNPIKILILIGPEGDFSKEEIKDLEANHFLGISLGEQRFRTETAALQAVFAIDWELNNF